MLTIQDRDLAAADPWLFIDARQAGTTLASAGGASVSALSLVSSSSLFADAGVTTGHVVTVDNEVLEVTQRVSQTSLSVTKVRGKDDEPAIPPTAGTGLPIDVTTFARIIEEERAKVLATLRLDGAEGDGSLGESAVMDEGPLRQLIIARTLASAYRLAWARDSKNDIVSAKADVWEERAREAAERSGVPVDIDGDGVADSTRRADVIVLKRS